MNLVERDVIETQTPVTVPSNVVQTDSGSLMQIIGRIAQDPTIDLNRFERLIAMQERMEAQRAERAFTVALSAMQPKLPVVDQKGTIVIRDKNDQNKIIQQTPFAKWEDINEAISPFLSEHGFSLSFKAGRSGDQVLVTAILRHKDGHKEETTMPLALDTSGSKNNVQAVGSSIAYGKRYCAGLLLNITSRAKVDADDDGVKADQPEFVSADQLATLRKAIAHFERDEARFCKVMKVPSLADMPAFRFKAAAEAIATGKAPK